MALGGEHLMQGPSITHDLRFCYFFMFTAFVVHRFRQCQLYQCDALRRLSVNQGTRVMLGDLSFYNSSLNLAVLAVCTDRKTKLINTQHYSPIKASKNKQVTERRY